MLRPYAILPALPVRLPAALIVPAVFVAAGCDEPREDRDSPPVTSPSPVKVRDPACQGRADGQPFCRGGQVVVCTGGTPEAQPGCGPLRKCHDGKCVSGCPDGEVYIPATGPEGFTMGRDKLDGKDTPHTVVLTQPFCMDATEVTAGAYEACIRAGKCEEPYKWDPWASYPRFPDRPVNLVSMDKASAYCAWKGKRLPTEAQWEWAATGGEEVEWPWGNEEPTCQNDFMDFTPFGAPKSAPGGDVGCRGGGPSKVKSFPKGAKSWPSGKLYDLAGNVWEWTRDMAIPYPSEKRADPEVTEVPGKPDNTVFSIRGGGWNRDGVCRRRRLQQHFAVMHSRGQEPRPRLRRGRWRPPISAAGVRSHALRSTLSSPCARAPRTSRGSRPAG